LCPVCGFIKSNISPDDHIKEVHHHEREGGGEQDRRKTA